MSLDQLKASSKIPAAKPAVSPAPAVNDNDQEFGPVLPAPNAAPSHSSLPKLTKEGEMIQAFLESGKRIPRRGEIGLTSEEISTFEGQVSLFPFYLIFFIIRDSSCLDPGISL